MPPCHNAIIGSPSVSSECYIHDPYSLDGMKLDTLSSYSASEVDVLSNSDSMSALSSIGTTPPSTPIPSCKSSNKKKSRGKRQSRPYDDSQASPSRPICLDHLKGVCSQKRWHCKYAHIDTRLLRMLARPDECMVYVLTGHCKYGEKCTLKHPERPSLQFSARLVSAQHPVRRILTNLHHDQRSVENVSKQLIGLCADDGEALAHMVPHMLICGIQHHNQTHAVIALIEFLLSLLPTDTAAMFMTCVKSLLAEFLKELPQLANERERSHKMRGSVELIDRLENRHLLTLKEADDLVILFEECYAHDEVEQ
eukprot:NODE_38_length_2945_cov_1925.029454_g23_i0.p1 GENE.NODE_38_length_2945_cov_1925.029454_g23_i0~~NODE_38_length_2945_cov_1925.029454_g23_i0.p1  ORF type:complete len:347 (-),score=80.64 NODE_38_length_2945_cov_1925.029454_g23_i0:1905-2834(-)